MRVLTVRQPWATAIISLGKDVENRTRNIAGDYRGPVAIHTAKREEPVGGDAAKRIYALTGYLPLFSTPHALGAIIGVVDLVDVHQPKHRTYPCSKWAEPECWHLKLANPRMLAEPIPFRGALGLRHLDDATRLLVEAGLS